MADIVVLGAAGMLGTDVSSEFRSRGLDVIGLDLADLDLTDPVQVARLSSGEFGKPAWCVNCAAYTAVDKAEEDEDAAYRVNALAPGYVAQACGLAGIRLLHVSTDFVFDGEANEPYREDAKPNPLGAYGRTKLAGEEAATGAVIARTAWLYGPAGPCFPKTMARVWQAGKALRVVADQVGCPTYTGDLARVLADLVEKDAEPGVYHTAGVEPMSWHRFASMALEVLARSTGDERPVEIEPIATDDWPTPARRPRYSVLSFAKCAALGIAPMRPTLDALEEFWRRVEGA